MKKISIQVLTLDDNVIVVDWGYGGWMGVGGNFLEETQFHPLSAHH